MRDLKTISLNLMLKVNHEQCAAFRDNIIFISNIAKWVFKRC